MWKIAIVDDDFLALKGLSQVIAWEQLGAQQVGQAMNGKDGLEMIRQTEPDIVLTDVYMPRMSGLDMIEQLRNGGFEGQIVILSGYSDFEYARRALRLNVDDYLSKPVTVDEINAVLRKAIARSGEEAFQKMEHAELRSKWLQYEPFFLSEWARSVIIGTVNFRAVRDAVPPCEQWRIGMRHAVLGLQLVDTERIQEAGRPDLGLFRFAIRNIVQELLDKHWPQSSFVELYHHRSAVLLHAEPEMFTPERIRELGQTIVACIETYLKLQVEFGCGGIKYTLPEVAASTEEAFGSLGSFGDDKQQPGSPAELFERPIHFYQQLVDALRLAQQEKATEIAEQFIAHLQTERPALPPAHLQEIGQELWAILSYELHEVNKGEDGDWFAESGLKEALGLLQTTVDLRAWLVRTIESLCHQLGFHDNMKHKQAVDFMIRYIHDNYASELTIEELARQVYISKSYLNKIFKKYTSVTFNTYVTQVRMDRAYKLLMERKHLVYEVSEMVGYTNIPYFTSLFKKSFGVAPGELVRSSGQNRSKV
jgi:two-component system, response regulator YesN